MTRADLAKMTGRRMSAVLADLPSVRLVPMRGSGGSVLATRRRGTAQIQPVQQPGAPPGGLVMLEGFCAATVYLNNAAVYSGAPSEPLFDINTLAPDDIEALEYYASANEVPPRYAGKNVECGVLVIHTRRRAR